MMRRDSQGTLRERRRTGGERRASSGEARRRTERALSPARWPLPSAESASGCFETMRAYRGRLFRLKGHLDRLEASAKYVAIRWSMTRPQLARRLTDALAASGIREAVVRVALIPRPDGSRIADPSVVVLPAALPAPALYRRGLRLSIVPTKKFPVSQIDPQSKFSARLGSVLAVMEAQLRSADEAIFLDASGSVTESTASNLGAIKDGTFLAPPCWLGLLAGITWHVVTEAACALKIPVQETPLTRHDLYNADEVFLTSTLKEVIPVTVIDGRAIGTGKPGPYAKRLLRKFREIVDREIAAQER